MLLSSKEAVGTKRDGRSNAGAKADKSLIKVHWWHKRLWSLVKGEEGTVTSKKTIQVRKGTLHMLRDILG